MGTLSACNMYSTDPRHHEKDGGQGAKALQGAVHSFCETTSAASIQVTSNFVLGKEGDFQYNCFQKKRDFPRHTERTFGNRHLYSNK